MPAGRRTATAALLAVVVLSIVVLFAPGGAGEQRFPYDDKVVHCLLFALLAGTARWRCGPAVAALLVVAAYAPVSEVVQALALPRRSGDPTDVVADLAGVALGWWSAGRLLAQVEAGLSAGR